MIQHWMIELGIYLILSEILFIYLIFEKPSYEKWYDLKGQAFGIIFILEIISIFITLFVALLMTTENKFPTMTEARIGMIKYGGILILTIGTLLTINYGIYKLITYFKYKEPKKKQKKKTRGKRR